MYMQKNISLDIIAKVLLRDENSDIQWRTLLAFLWPPMTGDQIHVPYAVPGRHLNIHAKNCVSGCCCKLLTSNNL